MIDRNNLDRWLLRNPMPVSFPNKEAKAEFFASMPEAVKNEWDRRKAAQDCLEPDFNRQTVERARKRMMRVDALPPDIRKVVHEYNLEVVQEFLNHGVRTAKSIKHLIDTVVGADFPNGQPRFKLNKQPTAKRNPIDLNDEDDDEYYVIPSR